MAEYKWLAMLPGQFRVNNVEPERLHALDTLRQSWSLNNSLFAEILIQSDWATKRLQKLLYEDGKRLHPELPDSQLFNEIIMSRTSSRIPMGLDVSEKEVDVELERIGSIDELIEFVMKKESEEASPDPSGMRSRMNSDICRIMEAQEALPEIRTDIFTRLRN